MLAGPQQEELQKELPVHPLAWSLLLYTMKLVSVTLEHI